MGISQDGIREVGSFIVLHNLKDQRFLVEPFTKSAYRKVHSFTKMYSYWLESYVGLLLYKTYA